MAAAACGRAGVRGACGGGVRVCGRTGVRACGGRAGVRRRCAAACGWQRKPVRADGVGGGAAADNN
jgi:hypothetical protein